MNEKIKCVDNRGYSLTEEQEYEIIKREGNFIFVNNDKDKLARYSAEMFEAPAPPPPARTEQDCIASITHNSTSTKYINLQGNEVNIGNSLTYNSPGDSFSCGALLVTNINTQISIINQAIVPDQDTSGDDLLDLKKALISSHLKNYMSTKNKGIFLLSTNVTNNNNVDEDVVSILDEISDFNSEPELNPNSGNQIKVWGFLKSNL